MSTMDAVGFFYPLTNFLVNEYLMFFTQMHMDLEKPLNDKPVAGDLSCIQVIQVRLTIVPFV